MASLSVGQRCGDLEILGNFKSDFQNCESFFSPLVTFKKCIVIILVEGMC